MRTIRASATALVVFAVVITFLSSAIAQTPNYPLTGGELLALVAGESLDENVVHAIVARGLAFRPTDNYRELLTTAGADVTVLNAVKNAKFSSDVRFPEQMDTPELLGHLAAAGKYIRAQQLENAGKELVAALESRIGPEAGFVMGDLQDRMGEWENGGAIYGKVLQTSPNFPVAHARLSYDAYRLGDAELAIREAQAALQQYKDDPEAHKNMGLGLATEGKMDGAISEYREALRLKPDYAAVHCDIALVFHARNQIEEAVVEMRKAVALDPNVTDYHYDLGKMLGDERDVEGSIKEYRAAKRLDPSRLDVRQNLAVALRVSNLEAAKAEFTELITMQPEFGLAHLGLGSVLMKVGDYGKAEIEFRKAAELDPSDASSFSAIGDALDHQGKFQDAIQTYRHAIQLDSDSVAAALGLGRAYLDVKDYASAVRQLRVAVNLAPGIWDSHALLSEALARTSDLDGAIAEARVSIRIEPNNPQTLAKLAKYLEQKGDLRGALEQCKIASTWNLDAEGNANCAEIQKKNGVPVTMNFSNDSTYRVDGSAPAAKAIVPAPSAPAAKTSTANAKMAPPMTHPPVVLKPGQAIESAWQDAFNAGNQEFSAHHYASAEKILETAASLAEKLEPFNERSLQTFDLLGAAYFQDGKFDESKATFQRELDLSQKVLGAQSMQNQHALFNLATLAVAQKDFATAEGFYLQLVSNAERNYDPSDTRISIYLFQLTDFYQEQKSFDKAEPYLLRALTIGKQADGDVGVVAESYDAKVQNFYIAWGKYDKAEPYCRATLALREKFYGPTSREVGESVKTLSEILEKLGRAQEAESLRKRSEAILGAGAAPKQ
jgi:tetratricopeptide (TPR) repeat protein